MKTILFVLCGYCFLACTEMPPLPNTTIEKGQNVRDSLSERKRVEIISEQHCKKDTILPKSLTVEAVMSLAKTENPIVLKILEFPLFMDSLFEDTTINRFEKTLFCKEIRYGVNDDSRFQPFSIRNEYMTENLLWLRYQLEPCNTCGHREWGFSLSVYPTNKKDVFAVLVLVSDTDIFGKEIEWIKYSLSILNWDKANNTWALSDESLPKVDPQYFFPKKRCQSVVNVLLRYDSLALANNVNANPFYTYSIDSSQNMEILLPMAEYTGCDTSTDGEEESFLGGV